MTFTDEMLRRGLRPTSVMLERVVRPATPEEATALEVRSREPVVHLRRLRRADDRPMVLESTVLIGACAEAVLLADLEHGSLHEALLRAGFTLRRGTGTIRSEPATAEDARLLDVVVGQPLLVERSVIADAHGHRIEATESRYPGDRYALDVTFDVLARDRRTPDEG